MEVFKNRPLNPWHVFMGLFHCKPSSCFGIPIHELPQVARICWRNVLPWQIVVIATQGASDLVAAMGPFEQVFKSPVDWWHIDDYMTIWARVKRRYERLQLRSVITTQNMWFTVCSDRGPYVAIPLFRLCLWLKLPVGRMTFQSFDVRVRHWSSRSGLVFLGSCKMACRQVYMR